MATVTIKDVYSKKAPAGSGKKWDQYPRVTECEVLSVEDGGQVTLRVVASECKHAEGAFKPGQVLVRAAAANGLLRQLIDAGLAQIVFVK